MQHLERSLLGTGRVESAAASAVHSLPLSDAVPFAVGWVFYPLSKTKASTSSSASNQAEMQHKVTGC